MDPGASFDRLESDVVRALTALGAAWLTYQLYPNPKEQPVFLRAVEQLNEGLGAGELIGVGPGVFMIDGEEWVPEREGVEKLARRLFLHDVEAIKIAGDATPDGLAQLFAALAEDDAVLKERGGIRHLIGAVGGIGLEVIPRGLLSFGIGGEGSAEADEEVTIEDLLGLTELARIAVQGASPGEIASAVVDAEESGDSEALVDDFLDSYHELYDRVTDAVDDEIEGSVLTGIGAQGPDPYKTVRSFIEAFFHLPRWIQQSILEKILGGLDDPRHQTFLDQFSGNDLTDLLPDLTQDASQMLLRYAVAASAEPGGHPLDLLGGLSSSSEVEDARRAVAARVSDVLRRAKEGEGVVAESTLELRTEMEEPLDPELLQVEVLRGLLECEDRRDRFQRAVRVWTGRVTRYIRDGDLEGADRLMMSILRNPSYASDQRELVEKAIERMTTPELLRLLADKVGEEQSEAAGSLLAAFGRQVIDQLVAQLAAERDGRVRRSLTEMLAGAARDNPKALEPYLSDDRWFVVRNLTTALGRTGNPDAMLSVNALTGHGDHRVRMEALRSAVRLEGADAAPTLIQSLADENDQVRSTALTLLRNSDHAGLDRLLVGELQSRNLQAEMATEVVGVLGQMESSLAREELKRLAGRRFAMRSYSRTLRAAAKAAMETEAA